MVEAIVEQYTRPRNVNKWRAAAILYGDWGTSKAYVIGLAFAIGGYSSFWLIFYVSLLCIIVGINYIAICKAYPNGGGVYSSVRNRSKVLALVGGFFLTADYIITAALSALSAFKYLGVSYAEYWAMGAILTIGALNFLGPRNSGSVALGIGIGSFICVVFLGIVSFYHIPEAIHHVQHLTTGIEQTWVNFVGVIVALSGIEAIANTTGVMQLDPGSTLKNPSVVKTARPAILMVMVEVCLFTTLFSLAADAIPGLQLSHGTVLSPDGIEVRDSMLSYLGETFSTPLFGQTISSYIGFIIGVSFSLLLLSAVNTALVGLTSLLFVMSQDGQMPQPFQLTNRYGVPLLPLIFAVSTPVIILNIVSDIPGLANLYAVGFIGAIATNLGATSTDMHVRIKRNERIFMFFSFLILLAIEITLLVEKSDARAYVSLVLAIGLLLRALVLERKDRLIPYKPQIIQISDAAVKVFKKNIHLTQTKSHPFPPIPLPILPPKISPEENHLHQGSILCATTHPGKALEFALKESIDANQKLNILFVREQKVLAGAMYQSWIEDVQASRVFDFALNFFKGPKFQFLYEVSDSPALNIVEQAKKLNVSKVILGMSRESRWIKLIRGNVIADVRDRLPPDIDLIVVS